MLFVSMQKKGVSIFKELIFFAKRQQQKRTKRISHLRLSENFYVISALIHILFILTQKKGVSTFEGLIFFKTVGERLMSLMYVVAISFAV